MSTINIRQLDILKSAKAMAEKVTDGQTIANDDLFIFQNESEESAKMKVVTAQALQSYFSDVDIDSTDSGVYTMVLMDPDQSAPGAADSHTLYHDSQGTSALSFNVSTNLFAVSGSIRLTDDSDSLIFGVDQDVSLLHVPDTGLRINDAMALQFRSAASTISSTAVGQLDIDATTVQIAGDVDVDAGTLQMDATGEAHLIGAAGVLLKSTEAAADAIIINASDTSGGIDLIASGSDASLSGLSLDADSADFGSALQVNIDSATSSTSTATGALVVDGGVGIAENLNVGGNATITGNLTVNGTTTTVDTQTLLVEDAIIQLGSGSSGNAAGDRGFLFSLGDGNQAFYWDEDDSEFALISTTDDGSSTDLGGGRQGYSNLHIGNLNASGTLNVDGATTLNGTVTIGDSSIDGLVVNGTDVDFANLDTITNDVVVAADSLMIRDASAEAAKHITVAEFGEYLSKGQLTSTSGSNGIRVNGNGVLSIEPISQHFTSATAGTAFDAAQGGTHFTLTLDYDNQIVTSSFDVFLNGVKLVDGAAGVSGVSDFTVSGTTLVMGEDIDANDVISVRYLTK